MARQNRQSTAEDKQNILSRDFSSTLFKGALHTHLLMSHSASGGSEIPPQALGNWESETFLQAFCPDTNHTVAQGFGKLLSSGNYVEGRGTTLRQDHILKGAVWWWVLEPGSSKQTCPHWREAKGGGNTSLPTPHHKLPSHFPGQVRGRQLNEHHKFTNSIEEKTLLN